MLFATVRATGAMMPPLIILVISVLLVRTSFAYFFRSVIGEEALWWSSRPARSRRSRWQPPITALAAGAPCRAGRLPASRRTPASGVPRQRAHLSPETPNG
ncbi:hypothetical protein [Mesorhizobium sp.]|uniref:hypothetical protein n=1 Tax=Mesorhizobium sp. TaxID=1871066 RepID=UPI00257F7D6E|nr:hypothetical protein [Mesorhizobium sp.]